MSQKFYCVGFHWNDRNPTSQLKRFLEENIWQNGYDSKFLNTVNNVPVGARLAAKTTHTRKVNGKTVSVLQVHAIGTVTKNLHDGKTLEVKWDKDFKPFSLDGRGAYRSTISQVWYPENIQLIFGSRKKSDLSIKANFSNWDDLVFDFHSNIILYGPPGTGKTFSTIDKAVSIIDGIKENKLSNIYNDRTALKEHFDELLIDDWEKSDGQIVFTTFHQSFSYEDFVEGIKPVISKTEAGHLSYKIEDGIFKKICKKAAKKQKRSISLEEQEIELTEDLFEELYYTFADTLLPVNQNESNCELETKEKYKFELFKNTAGSITIKSGYQKTRMSASFNELKKVLFDNKKPTYPSYEPIIIDKILENKNYKVVGIDEEKKRYVLIIDEINRGNISQIFGELITLIETDKRGNGDESLSVTLPYSKESFSIPSNLYIIGTMNTADRSVEALDIALRRRFVFEELEPKAELLTPEHIIWEFWWNKEKKAWDDPEYLEVEKPLYDLLGVSKEFDDVSWKEELWNKMENEGKKLSQITLFSDSVFSGVNLSKLLIHINCRIDKLLGRDYRIGHAYLMKVASISDLKTAFQNKILPLLQEYFFNDFGRIGLVVGEVFIATSDSALDINLMKVLKYDTGDLNESKTYHTQNVFMWDDSIFIKNVKAIYGG